MGAGATGEEGIPSCASFAHKRGRGRGRNRDSCVPARSRGQGREGRPFTRCPPFVSGVSGGCRSPPHAFACPICTAVGGRGFRKREVSQRGWGRSKRNIPSHPTFYAHSGTNVGGEMGCPHVRGSLSACARGKGGDVVEGGTAVGKMGESPARRVRLFPRLLTNVIPFPEAQKKVCLAETEFVVRTRLSEDHVTC